MDFSTLFASKKEPVFACHGRRILDTWTGQAAASAAVFVAVTNLQIILWYAGMNALMSAPHLITWIPLEVALAMKVSGMAGMEPVSDTEPLLAVTLLVVNDTSYAV